MDYQRYTTEDAIIIHNHLSNYPSNFSEGFRQAAIELGRSYKSVQLAYYKNAIIKAYFLANPVLGLMTKNTLVQVNRKNCPNIEGVTHPNDYQVRNPQSVGIIEQSNTRTVIRMQTATFAIGNITITGDNIQIETIS